MDHTLNWFTSSLEERGIILSPLQLKQFERYYELLIEWNERMNLTGITERDAVYEKHFYDSISLAFFTNMNKVARLADIGSGAGFPSIPLKICFPHIQVTIVDSLNKRIQFLNHLCSELNLEQVICLHSRAEDASRLSDHRDGYDVVTARAVARLRILNEFCLPFAKPGGLFVAMKGSQLDEELKEADFSLRELKGSLLKEFEFELPNEKSKRHFVFIAKSGLTPKKYPRKAGLPLKQPL